MLTPGNDDLYRWESGYQLELLASDFILDSGTGPEHPDFSVGGGPVQLGFFASNGTANASQTSTSSGIDNWSATLDRTPLPSISRRGMVLLSLLLVALASWAMKHGATREAA